MLQFIFELHHHNQHQLEHNLNIQKFKETNMKGQPEVKTQLNLVLKALLTGINQYFLHSRMCEDWGFDTLKSKDYSYSIYLMKASDKLIKRILFLEGLPNLQDLGSLYIGEDVPQMLSGNLQFDESLRSLLAASINICEKHEDFISRECLQAIQNKVEDQIDWLEAQIDLVEKLGLQNYLQANT